MNMVSEGEGQGREWEIHLCVNHTHAHKAERRFHELLIYMN